jgi:hypothetical protein
MLKNVSSLKHFKDMHNFIVIFGTAAWNQKFRVKNRKIRFGLVPHIHKEFFGTGNVEMFFTTYLK